MQRTVVGDGIIFGADYITCSLHIMNINEDVIESIALSLILSSSHTAMGGDGCLTYVSVMFDRDAVRSLLNILTDPIGWWASFM